MDWSDFVTVGTWADEKRKSGTPVDHKWFYTEVANGGIPSITVGGTTYARRVHLDDAWPRYKASVRESLARKQKAVMAKKKTLNDEIIERLKNIEAAILALAGRQ